MTGQEQVSNFNQLLMTITWIAVILFFVEIVLNATYAIYIFITANGDYSKFKSFFQLTSLPMMINAAIYLISKYFVYIGLYLRLKTLLHDTVFEYTKSKYTIVKILIFVSCILIVPALVVVRFAYHLGFLLAGIYFILDIIIPVYINILFIRKIREIRIFMLTHFDRNNAFSSSITSETEDDNETNKDEKENAALYRLMIRCTFMALLVVLSSFGVLMYMVFRNCIVLIVGKDLMVTWSFQVLTAVMDSLINLICVVSYFAFTKKFSDFFSNKVFCCCKGLSTRVIERLIET